MVRVTDGSIIPVSADWLMVQLGRLANFQTYDERKDSFKPCDPPQRLCKAIISLVGQWGLPQLKGVVDAPIIDPQTGRIIEVDGFDSQAGIYLHMPDPDGWESVPENPTDDQCRTAVEVLNYPFQDFPFIGPVDRGGWLACLLTAVCRRLLPTAPAFGLSATCPGTGKTLLALCAAELSGTRAELMPPVGDDENEVKKRLFAALRGGGNTLITDNEIRPIDSSTLCAVLTTDTLSDRILGESQTATVTTSVLIILTGNNLVVVGDLSRRLIKINLDAGVEKPWDRAFDLDPREYTRSNRLRLTRAALTLLRGFKNAGTPRPDGGRMASFEIWSDFIRGCVHWVGRKGWLDVVDPAQSINSNFEVDPETRKLCALLNAWADEFGNGCEMTVAAAIKRAERNLEGELYACLDEIAGERGKINPRRLGRWIERHQGRIYDGKCFVREGTRQHTVLWSVSKAESREFCEFGEFLQTPRGKLSGDNFMEGLKENPRISPNSPDFDEERAAILEFDAGVSREEAEKRARLSP